MAFNYYQMLTNIENLKVDDDFTAECKHELKEKARLRGLDADSEGYTLHPVFKPKKITNITMAKRRKANVKPGKKK
jgi:hypothetical protein